MLLPELQRGDGLGRRARVFVILPCVYFRVKIYTAFSMPFKVFGLPNGCQYLRTGFPERIYSSARAPERRWLVKTGADVAGGAPTSSERNCSEAGALEGRWLVKREFAVAMRPWQPPRGRDAGPGWYSLPPRAAAPWRRQPGWYTFPLRCIVSTQHGGRGFTRVAMRRASAQRATCRRPQSLRVALVAGLEPVRVTCEAMCRRAPRGRLAEATKVFQ